jgi:hypothetical protein
MSTKNICEVDLMATMSEGTNAIVEENGNLRRVNLTKEFDELNTKIEEIQTKTNMIHDFAECRTSYSTDYSTYKYICFYQNDTNTSLFNEDIATFNGNGLITINQNMRALININVVGSTSTNDDKRLWMSLNNYSTGESYAQYIVCNTTFATGVISIVLDLTAGTQLGLILYDSFRLNTGLSGSYIQIVKL